MTITVFCTQANKQTEMNTYCNLLDDCIINTQYNLCGKANRIYIHYIHFHGFFHAQNVSAITAPSQMVRFH